ncbi:unnamed protein product [Phaedon cochleariae]|uniref:Centrosomal protein of 78 kDa n=1 Tax=Phaedon cochleariae TaxID=80249 RepID=A0A9P0GSE1_PHACE|nr:unnamed protein product [Phaedon cochleariae]
MDAAKSATRANPKPINVFYVWYTELCRRLNCNPAPAVKPAKPKCQTILEFVADRLKVEEWNPIVNALRNDTSLHVLSIKSRVGPCQFMHDIDTEEKARHMKRRFGSLWTAYVLRILLKSISTSLRNTQVLTCLELDGLPMFGQYLEPLLQALKKNKTVKHLSFANCLIYDAGCQLVCTYLKFTPNIEVVNLSGCGLAAESGQHLAKLIKYQQINRYCESWHNSLRYENPQSGTMRGIKRITINCNSDFGDEGFTYILEELEDDLWIKALDLQRCNISENIAAKILDVIQYNRSLEIVDLRQNDLLYISTIEKILQLLRDKQQFGYQPEFQWCNTAMSLTWNSVHESTSKFSIATNIHKTKSAPVKTSLKTSTFNIDQALRKSKTVDNVQKKMDRSSELKVLELNSKLQLEIHKRKEIEKRNEELKKKLELIQGTVKMKQDETNGVKRTLKVVMDTVEKKGNHRVKKDIRENTALPQKDRSSKEKNGVKLLNGMKNGLNKEALANGHKNGFKNGFSSKILDSACKIFESLLKKEPVDESKEEEELHDYFPSENQTRNNEIDVESDISSGSQMSLYQFMEELKHAEGSKKYAMKENHKR